MLERRQPREAERGAGRLFASAPAWSRKGGGEPGAPGLHPGGRRRIIAPFFALLGQGHSKKSRAGG